MFHAILLPLLMMAAASGTVTTPDGVRIHYETAGKGRPALVLVHCWTCDSSFWKDQIARLAKNRQVVTLDLALSALRNTRNYDAAPGFDALKVPIVAVNGDRFPTNFAANRRHAPQFDAVIMKGVGHYPMLEDPARFGTLLDEALRKVEGA